MYQSFILPYLRSSPVHIPRRDLSLSTSDGLVLETTVVQSDDPASPPIELTGGVGGPAVYMTVWPDDYGCYPDYGVWLPLPHSVFWSAFGTIIAPGTFRLSIPLGTITTWPRRCAYVIQLLRNAGAYADTLASGYIHVSHVGILGGAPALPGVGARLLTSGSVPILTSAGVNILI